MKPYYESIFLPCDPFRIKGFVTTTMEHVIEVHPHWHAEVELLYYMDGCALQQVNDMFFTAEPGDIVIIGRDQLHSTYTIAKSNCRIMVLQFDAASLFGADACGIAQPGADYETGAVYSNPIKTLDATGERLKLCMEDIYREMERKQAAYEHLVMASLHQFTGILARQGLYSLSGSSAENISYIHAMLQNTFKLVDDSFCDEITLGQGALASNLSVTHFCRLFKKTTGMTFHEYLTFYRINRAEQMLMSGKKLTEIAFACGFGCVSAFIRNFKKYKQCTPSGYQNGVDGE
jgi:AraC family transcriptional regulator, transcriptional activator of pobA